VLSRRFWSSRSIGRFSPDKVTYICMGVCWHGFEHWVGGGSVMRGIWLKRCPQHENWRTGDRGDALRDME